MRLKAMEISIYWAHYATKSYGNFHLFFCVAYETKITFSLDVLPQLNLFVGHLNARSRDPTRDSWIKEFIKRK